MDRPFWKQTKVVGHRGAGANNAADVADPAGLRRRTHVTENTLLSFVTAASLGAEYVEFDVQLTKDRVPVVHHNFLVNLPGDLAIPVTHLTVKQFESLTPRSNAPPRLRSSGDLRERERVMTSLGLDVESHDRLAQSFYTGIRVSAAAAAAAVPCRVLLDSRGRRIGRTRSPRWRARWLSCRRGSASMWR